MTENEKIELFDKWYDENYDEWAEGEEGIALREELEQAFKGGIEALEKENTELKTEKGCKTCTKFDEVNLTKAKEIIKILLDCLRQDTNDPQTNYYVGLYMTEAEQFLKNEPQSKWVNPARTTNDNQIKLSEVEK